MSETPTPLPTTPSLDEAAANALNMGVDKLGELSDKFGEIALAHGQDAVDLGLNVARVSAGSELVSGLLFLALSIILIVFCNKYYRWLTKDEADFCASPACMIVGGGWCAAVIGSLMSAKYIINLWAWVGIFYPELWVAKEILGW